MLKPIILILTAVLALGAAVSATSPATAAAACGARCAPPPPPPPPPPPGNPDPGTPNDNSKPADEGPSFSGGSTNENQMLIACRVPAGEASDTTNLAFRNIGDKPIPGTETSEAITGNFFLDPEFLTVPVESTAPPLVLLD